MSCPRTFEVEAARDGRLADRSSLDRHLHTCAACRAHSETLDELASVLRQLPVAPDDQLAAQRGRHVLQAAFDARLHARGRRRARWVGLVAPAVVGLAIVYLVVLQPRTRSTDISARDPVQIDADHARWSRVDDGATTIVRLDDGDAHFHVDHRGAPRRLVVIVPDGELEDLGTTFLVRVRRGHTTEITVDEGGVLFRRGLETAIPVVAGDHWVAHDPVAVSAAPADAPTPAVTKPRTPTKTMTSSRREPAAVDADVPIERDLRAAIASLDAGDNGVAATTLRRIVAQYASDPRAEDAEYLLVIALQRASDVDGARDAARDYLRRFPNGFRRTAIEPIAR